MARVLVGAPTASRRFPAGCWSWICNRGSRGVTNSVVRVRFGADGTGYSILEGAEDRSARWRQDAMRIATVPDKKSIRGERAYRFMGDFDGETASMVLEPALGRAHSFKASLHLTPLSNASGACLGPLDPWALLSGKREVLDRPSVLKKLSPCSDLLPWLEAAIHSCNSGEGRAELRRWSPTDQCSAFWGLFPLDLTRRVDVVSAEALPGPRRSGEDPAGRFVFEPAEEPMESPADLRRFAASLAAAVKVERVNEFVGLLERCEREVEDLGLADFARCVNVQFGTFESPAARCEEVTALIQSVDLPDSVIQSVGKAAIGQLTFSGTEHILEVVDQFVPRWSELGRGNAPSGSVLAAELCRQGQQWLSNRGSVDRTVSPLSLRVVVALHEVGGDEAARLALQLRERIKGEGKSSGSVEDWCQAVALIKKGGLGDVLKDKLRSECEERVLRGFWNQVKQAPDDDRKRLFRLRRDLARSGLPIGHQPVEASLALDAGGVAFSFFRRSAKEDIDWSLFLPSAYRMEPAALEVAMGEWLGVLGPGPWRWGWSDELRRLWSQSESREAAQEAMEAWLRHRWLLRGNPWLLDRARPGSRIVERVKTALRVAVLLAIAALLGLGAVKAYPRVAPALKAWLSDVLREADEGAEPEPVKRLERDESSGAEGPGPGSSPALPDIDGAVPKFGVPGGEAPAALNGGASAGDLEATGEQGVLEDAVEADPDGNLKSGGEASPAPAGGLETAEDEGPVTVPQPVRGQEPEKGAGAPGPAVAPGGEVREASTAGESTEVQHKVDGGA